MAPSAVRSSTLVAALTLCVGVAYESLPPAATAGEPTPAPVQAPERGEFRLVPSTGEPTLQVSDDLEIDLLLREPTVANPVYLTFDERGRMWVTQYRQYPWPAGLKLLSRDSVWRNAYSPPFAPPPPHAADSPFHGLDQISIHEDADGDGSFEKTKVFLDGLNLAVAALPGRGGVFVMNPPYLLFYADRDRDDQPDDAKPEVLLSGFGFEDSHALANSLRWGPDGWIYAAQGSTVSSAVVTYDAQGQPMTERPVIHSMGQNIWRYHPERRIYEIYAEGGGNAFGVEIDKVGRVFSGHNGGDTRGFHYVQGGYYQKGFAKHGQLSNPYAFDYLRQMKGTADERFTHTFCIYEAEGLPERYRDLMFAVNPIGHEVVMSEVFADGSSRQTWDIGLASLYGAGERAEYFVPVDVQTGPDGAIYLADWYSQQANHYRNHEGKTDPTLGRVYRVRGRDGYSPAKSFDLAALSSQELVDAYLFHPNRWYRQQARRILGDRRDQSVVPRLWDIVQQRTDQDALEAFWALVVSNGMTAERMEACLAHANPFVRRWTLHVLGDTPEMASALSERLLTMARDEENVETRCQLAATAKRLPADVAVPIVFAMLQRQEDAADVFIPEFLWWALESHAASAEVLFTALGEARAWTTSFEVGGYSMPQNLMRRYAMAGRQADLQNCGMLLSLAPDEACREKLVEALAGSFAGRPMPTLPDRLAAELAKTQGPFAQLMAIRRQDSKAIVAGFQTAADPDRDADFRVAVIQALSDVQADPATALLVFTALLGGNDEPRINNAALLALQKYADDSIGGQIAAAWLKLPADSQAVAVQVLASRRAWAVALLAAIDGGLINADLVDPDVAERLRRYADTGDELAQRVAAHFPATNISLSEREARIEALATIVKDGQGAPLSGRDLFHGKATCGKCHRIFNEGIDVGPDLTAYNRTDLGRMLLALANPSAEIREGYEVFSVLTGDGRMLSGFKVDENDQVTILRGSDGQLQTISAEEIDEILPNETSLMPEGLLDQLTDEELRDLFAFLLSTTPPM